MKTVVQKKFSAKDALMLIAFPFMAGAAFFVGCSVGIALFIAGRFANGKH